MTQRLHYLNIALYLSLLVVGVGGLWNHAPDMAGTASKLIMTSVFYLPLLIMGLGILLKDTRLLTWLCFTLLFYFCGYVTQVMDPNMQILALVRAVIVVVLFTTILVYIRLRKSNKGNPDE